MSKDSNGRVPPRAAVRAALKVRGALMNVVSRIAPPQARVIELAYGYQATMMLHTAARLKIADQLTKGPKTAKTLARDSKVDADALHRMLRSLVSLGVFALDDGGKFSNNRLSETMKEGVPASMRSWLIYSGSKSNLAAWSDFPQTVATGKNAFERVHGKDCWKYFGEHPEDGAHFNQAMVDLTDFQAPAIAASYPFGNHQTICDVAGGKGALLSAILAQHPNVRGWLCDEPHVLEQAGAFLAERGVAGRVDRKPGNMFAEVPSGADAYILKDIIHDWDDARSIAILTSCRKAMQPGKKLLLVEIVVERNQTDLPGPMIDTHMMTVCVDGRQRSREEFRALFDRCGFRLENVVPTPMPASIVEGVAV